MPRNRIAVLVVFGAAFGILEAAVVVYLRELYYPEGFEFPLKPIPERILRVEVIREACTLVMLAAVGFLSGGRGLGRLAGVMVPFGVWDIAYYAGLYAFLGWPPSIMTWDILFLIPVPWAGPVLAPVLVSAALIAAGTVILIREGTGHPLRPSGLHWTLALGGGGLVLVSFMAPGPALMRGAMPSAFPWILFSLGLSLGLLGFYRALAFCLARARQNV